MKHALIAAGALCVLAPSLALAQPTGDKQDRKGPSDVVARTQSAPAKPMTWRHGRAQTGKAVAAAAITPSLAKGQADAATDHALAMRREAAMRSAPVNPRHGRPMARSASGIDVGARLFTYGGADRPALRAPAFRYPHGWGYRHWRVGQSLPFAFLASPFWFQDVADVGVPRPPHGYRWVRFGPDLLLVNARTGRIAEVVYGVFY